MFNEEDLLPVSALQHLVFCERRAALIYIESLWDENLFTAEGQLLHDRAHGCSIEARRDVRIARGLRLRSLRLGLSGTADVVEFHRVPEASAGVSFEDVSGVWVPFPVEYKRGILRHERSFEVQLCGQALCLEEMLATWVPSGALFYGKSVRRYEVIFDAGLRRETEAAAARLHQLVCEKRTPRAAYEKKCGKCSLLSLCLPKATAARRSVSRYLTAALLAAKEEKP